MLWKIKNTGEFSLEEYEKSLSLMSSERLSQIKKITHKKTRENSVLAELLCKQLVAEYSGALLENITIKRTENGKPYLKGKDLHISISHSGDFVAAAVCKTPVGIDIEVLKEPNLLVENRLCTESDSDFLNAADGDKALRFYKIWTAKEAYFKREGTGITNLKSVSYNELQPIHFFESQLIITIIK